MVLVAGYELVQRQERRFRGWLAYGLGNATLLLVGGLATLYAVRSWWAPAPWYAPRYIVPILGMVLGNTLTGVSLALQTLTEGAERERAAIEARIALGATRFEAFATVLRRALRTAITPLLNIMAVAGIVSLPGMMTGQILAGADPARGRQVPDHDHVRADGARRARRLRRPRRRAAAHRRPPPPAPRPAGAARPDPGVAGSSAHGSCKRQCVSGRAGASACLGAWRLASPRALAGGATAGVVDAGVAASPSPAHGRARLAGVLVEHDAVEEQLAGHVLLADRVFLDALFLGPVDDVLVEQVLGVLGRAVLAVVVDQEAEPLALGGRRRRAGARRQRPRHDGSVADLAIERMTGLPRALTAPVLMHRYSAAACQRVPSADQLAGLLPTGRCSKCRMSCGRQCR